jgi:hypothetical protein
MHLTFEIVDREQTHKVSPILRVARPEDALEITKIYRELYNNTYPYKEMEDVEEVRKMIEDPAIEWIIFQDPSFTIAGCITFVLDFNNRRGYIRGFMLRKKYQGYIDITKAMIGSMLGMLHKYKNLIFTWYVENRTVHSKSQYSMGVCGIAPIGFYPNKDVFLNQVESDLMQILYDEKALREYRSTKLPQILSCVEPCYEYSKKRYQLGEFQTISPEVMLNKQDMKSLKKSLIRHVSQDKYGYETIKFTFPDSNSCFEFLYTPQVQNFEKTQYKISSLEELSVFINEFKQCRKELGARYCEVFISAYEPAHQQLFYDAGLQPRGYIPSWQYNTREKCFEDSILFNIFDGTITENIQLIDEAVELVNTLNLHPTTYGVKKRSIPFTLDINQVFKKVIPPSLGIGVIGYLSLMVLSIFFASLFGTVNFALWTHTISDLGSAIVTPLPFLFDSACMLAGVVSIPYYCSLKRKLSQNTSLKCNIFLRCACILGIVGGLGYFFVGVFSLDRGGPNNAAHGLFAGIAFTGFVFSIAMFGGYILVFHNKFLRGLGAFGMLFPILFYGLYCIFGTPLVEWLLLISILGFSGPVSLWSFFR